MDPVDRLWTLSASVDRLWALSVSVDELGVSPEVKHAMQSNYMAKLSKASNVRYPGPYESVDGVFGRKLIQRIPVTVMLSLSVRQTSVQVPISERRRV